MKLRSFLSLLVFLTLVGMSGCAAPAAAPAPAASGPIQITLTTNPNPAASTGETELAIEVKDGAGKAIDGVSVVVTADMLSHSMGALEGLATDQGRGRYATKVPFGMAGDWAITVEVRQGDTLLATRDFTIPVQ